MNFIYNFIHKLVVWHSKKTNGKLRSFLAWIYLMFIRARNFLTYKDKNMFHFVNVELTRNCNRSCSYCPLPKHPDFKKEERMSFKDFKKIVNELKKINYSSNFCFAGYYEPLIDENIFKFIEYAKNNLKKARLILYTNGDFLNKEKFKKLKENSILLIISLHNDKDDKSYKRLLKITGNKNVIFKRNIEKYILSTRGGMVSVKNKEFKTSCIIPSVQLTIDVNGNVVICFDDFFSKYKYGNVKNSTIMNIWNSEKFKETKNSLLKGNTKEKICENCFSRNPTCHN